MTDRENHEREDHEQAETPTSGSPSRRHFMVGGAALGAFGALSGRKAGRLTSAQARLLDKATAASAASGASIMDVKHVVILMQENRSFDHYFGTLSGVRGFSDPRAHADRRRADPHGVRPVRYKPGPAWTPRLPAAVPTQRPAAENGQTTNDITHAGARSTRAGTPAPWTRS